MGHFSAIFFAMETEPGPGQDLVRIQKGVSKPLVFMQKQKPETGNSQKGKKSWGGPGPGPGQEGGEG